MVIVVKKMMVVTVGHECAQDGSNLSNNTFFCRRAAILSVQRNNKGSTAKDKNHRRFSRIVQQLKQCFIDQDCLQLWNFYEALSERFPFLFLPLQLPLA